MKYFSRIYLSFFLLISYQLAGGHQFSPTFTGTANSDEFIYLHTDRSYYFPGETVLFKAYILDSSKDQINDTLFIALIDQEGSMMAYKVSPLNNSMISGDIDLPEYMNEGAYILVASTRHTGNSPEKMFSKVIDIINPESELTTSVTFADSLYEPGGQGKARIRFSGRKNNAVSTGFSYRMTGTNGEILKGEGNTDKTGMTMIEFRLPEFDKNESLKLIITPDKKKSKRSTGIVIPTTLNNTLATSAAQTGSLRNIKISIRTNRLPRNDNAEVEISVTDGKGIPVIANLSVSASAILSTEASSENDDLVNYLSMKNLPSAKFSSVSNAGAVFNSQVTEYFAKSLIQTIQYPGKPFIVWQKDKKKAGRMKEPLLRQEGYTSDRDIYDIIMQIKPYRMENNMIVFGMQSMYSINNPEGAIIIVDGIKMGTNAAILSTIPVPDIANISVSTNIMDIQKYSAMNTVGIIEITMKKSKEFLNIQDPPSKTSTLFWGPDLITDGFGKVFLSFSCNEIKEVLITVNGISAEGLPGSSSVNFQAR
jgi:hypothetical protein